VIVLAGATTALGVACSFETDPFVSGRPDTAPIDSSKQDSFVEAGDDTRTDSTITDSGDTKVPPGDTADTKPIVDMGPPTSFPAACTAVGPTDTICIPKTTVSLGAANPTACAPSGCPHEQPEVPVIVNQFHIDQHEVTVKRFRTWWNLSPIPWPAANTTFFTSSSKDLRWRNTWPTGPTEPPTTGCTWAGATSTVNDDKPISCVDWFTALAFCMWEGKRLPTEAEWEAAAGGDDRLFPWSDPGTEDENFNDGDIDCMHALKGTCTPLGAAANSTVWGRSKYGVWNMAGSLAEWTLDAHAASYATVTAMSIDPITDPTTTTGNGRVARGGGWLQATSLFRTAARPASAIPATSPDSQIGFRCAKRM
jgi:formylglycine-generating enzyme required for sulfatase activity